MIGRPLQVHGTLVPLLGGGQRPAESVAFTNSEADTALLLKIALELGVGHLVVLGGFEVTAAIEGGIGIRRDVVLGEAREGDQGKGEGERGAQCGGALEKQVQHSQMRFTGECKKAPELRVNESGAFLVFGCEYQRVKSNSRSFGKGQRPSSVSFSSWSTCTRHSSISGLTTSA